LIIKKDRKGLKANVFAFNGAEANRLASAGNLASPPRRALKISQGFGEQNYEHAEGARSTMPRTGKTLPQPHPFAKERSDFLTNYVISDIILLSE